ncbi:MAG: ParB N-terminal domain-containing protein [Chloroflexi bacterium]|nr:ParB N-terminal domain-containing protein [Chloroflexota bacterium]
MMPPKNQTQRIDELLGGVTEELLLGNPQQFEDNSIRVERLLLEMVRPDPIQPRRVLPEQLHFAFHNNRLTPTQALRELVQLVQVAARQRGRPFNNVLELLPNPDDEKEEDPSAHLSPEEQLLHDLVNLAVTIRDDGQVNPLTVVDVSQGVTQQFRIETGERRYWATWLLRDFITNYSGDGMIPCIIIPAERSSVFRQAKENTARAGLSAIALARQAALLLLTVHGHEIPSQAVSNDFYRQALELDLRGKREYTESILSAMGGIDKARFSRLKALLHLSDEAMELADRHDIDEKKLRYLLSLPSEFHIEIVRQIIDFDLSSKQVRDLCQSDDGNTNETDENEKLSPSAIKIARVTQTISATSAQDIARALLLQEGDLNMAKARVQAMYKLLLETERYLGNE